MEKNDKKVDFDLSALSLKELIQVYEEMNEFMDFLNSNKIEEEKVEDEDE